METDDFAQRELEDRKTVEVHCLFFSMLLLGSHTDLVYINVIEHGQSELSNFIAFCHHQREEI